MSKPQRPWRLDELLDGIASAGSHGDILVHGLTLDSRKVALGDAFIALEGALQHGVTFAPAALAHGACVVLAQAPAPAVFPEVEPVLWIDHLRDRVGVIADRYFGQPSQALNVIGVTGTNGKTSTVQLLAQVLSGCGHCVATIGTLGAGFSGALENPDRTTPDAIQVHSLLARFRDTGASHVAMEVSSHALEQGRVNAVAFDIAVFTNLTRDHLDYHASMQEYAAAKAKLFTWPSLACAVINADDEFGRVLLAELPKGLAAWSYGIESAGCDLRASAIRSDSAGLRFHLATPWGEGPITTRLLGRFNVANLLAVAGCLGALGFDFLQIQQAFSLLEPVTGRMNRLGGDAKSPLIVVDYAHTPDALEQVLTGLRSHTQGRLICVFGCGGERDAGKRPQMGAVVERLADLAIVTDDNPRGENGDAIVAQILAGFIKPHMAMVERDRAAAIAQAVRTARAGDVVLIAGKGHEEHQEIAGRKLPFNDLNVARGALEAGLC